MNFPYGKYKNSRNAAWQCLIENHVHSLPVSVSGIAKSNGIRIATYSKNLDLIRKLGRSELMEKDGFSLLTSGGPIILYRDGLDPRISRFVVAHELGHIFLGHLLPLSENSESAEQEANVFASRLLAPACVLWGLRIHSAEEISEACNISMVAARIRAERMALLYDRERQRLADGLPSCFLLSSMERKVFDNFQGYITQNRR